MGHVDSGPAPPRGQPTSIDRPRPGPHCALRARYGSGSWAKYLDGDRRLPTEFRVVAIGRQEYDQDGFRTWLRQNLASEYTRHREAFEELLAHHLSLRRQRIALRAHGASPIKGRGALAASLRAGLPYALTGAQQRVFAEIARDMQQPVPMLRLVQGDVGSGKTVVAALAALRAIEAGKQVALMAPTELLAEQHLNSFRAWFEPLQLRVAWLAGKVTGKARAAVLAEIASGAGQLVVGTHALMQEGVRFKELGLAIIDEQHRFGVHQRLSLRDKGREGTRVPHQLVLTATPIPRTLAMSAYADLDVSVIDEMPPGRTPVTTVAIAGSRRDEVVERIRLACAEGRQVYWVCTLIDEAEVDDKPGQGALRIDASTSSIGFIVGCKSFFAGLLMNQTSPWSRAPHQKWSVPSFQP